MDVVLVRCRPLVLECPCKCIADSRLELDKHLSGSLHARVLYAADIKRWRR